MSGKTKAFVCPACGGPLIYGPQSGRLECEYCDSSYDPAQFEQAPTASEETDTMHTYICSSCGAEMITDENTAAACCPYCGSQTVVPGRFAGTFRPDCIIPFKTDRNQTIAALKRHYEGKRLLPDSFVDENHIEEIQGVYVPFWMFNCQSDGSMQFDCASSTTFRQGNTEVTVTKHYNAFRSGTLHFARIPADASSRMPDTHMDSIEPFDYRDIQPFTMTCMPGFLAEKYDVEPEDCIPRIRARCEKTFEDELTRTVTGYDTVTATSRNFTTHASKQAYGMLPVWLLATKWNGQNFLFAMNGQTGRLVGDLPMDKGKYWKYFAAILAALEIVAAAIAFFLTDASPLTLILLFAAPVLIDFVILASMKGQLQSVHEQKAAAYVTGQGLHLKGRQDTYVRTTERRRTIQKR